MGNGFGSGAIWNCYATGRTSAEGTVGGLCAIEAASYSSFWDMEATGQAASASGVGKTTAQMRTADTFRGWGRSGAWTIDEGADYPRLAWQNKPGVPLTTSAFPGNEGDGTARQPFLIHTAQELAEIGEFPGEWDRHYRLTADLDLAGMEGLFRLMGSNQIPFTGAFDGDGHSISNFQCPYATYGVGMFAFTRGAIIRRVTLINPRTEQDWSISVGTLVGQQVEGTVESMRSRRRPRVGVQLLWADSSAAAAAGRSPGATARARYKAVRIGEDVGGLVGKGERCNVNNSCARGAVDGLRHVGGLIGRMVDMGSVVHCYSAGRSPARRTSAA